MSKHTATKYQEIAEFEVELTISFHYEKGDNYYSFDHPAEPPSIEIREILATSPQGKRIPFEPSPSRENELKEWLLEHPERWE